MELLDRYPEELQKKIRSYYRGLMHVCSNEFDKPGLALIRKSFDFLLQHTSESTMFHGIHLVEYSTGLARMTVRELGLDAIGVSASLLIHGVDREGFPLEEVRSALSERTATVVEELLKISRLDTSATEGQAENMRNLVLTLASDFRVILLKIAERLYLMRQLGILTENEQIALACESRFIYSPLAHRLGLYNVMLEMEDLSMSILEKEAYQSIAEKLKASTPRRNKFIRDFIKPLQEDLEKEKFRVEI